MTDARERRLDNLCDATGENTKSKAIDCAADFYLKMASDTTAIPTGAFEELLATAERQGSLAPEEIATILDTEQLSAGAELSWPVGGSNE